MTLDTHNGVKVYTPTALKLYDWWVLNISNRYAWRCDTDKYLLPHFKNNLGENHMDIGQAEAHQRTVAVVVDRH